jgi:hypothetical protein
MATPPRSSHPKANPSESWDISYAATRVVCHWLVGLLANASRFTKVSVSRYTGRVANGIGRFAVAGNPGI